MRIESITLRKLKMRLKSPFETSFGITHERTLVLVEILADGVTGWSEVSAMEGPCFNSETVDTAWLIIRGFLAPLILGKELCSASDIPGIFAGIRGHEMARAELRMLSGTSKPAKVSSSRQIAWRHPIGNQNAVFPWGCKRLPKCFSKSRRRTTRRLSADQTENQTRQRPGFCTRRPSRPPSILLSVDANSAYTLADLEHLKRFDEFGLLMMEQPLWWDDIANHAKRPKAIADSDLSRRINSPRPRRRNRHGPRCRGASST